MKNREFLLLVVIALLLGWVCGDLFMKASHKKHEVFASPPAETGVWSLKDANVSSFYEQDGEVFPTGIYHDRMILINPEIVGERVYWTDEEESRLSDDALYSQGIKRWFYKDHLYQPEKVYRVLDGEETFLQTKGLGVESAPSPVEMVDHYLVEPPVIIGSQAPKVFLDWCNVPWGEQQGPDGPDPQKDHFFFREQVELVTP